MNNESNGIAIAGLVCAICAWLPILFIMGYAGTYEYSDNEYEALGEGIGMAILAVPATVAGFVLWLLGVIFSSIGLARARNRNLAWAGMVTSIVPVVLVLFGSAL